MTNLVELVPQGKTSRGGKEHNGPCEICGGGEDRLTVWTTEGTYVAPDGTLHEPIGRFYCRRCGSSGDAIDYLRMAHGDSFPAALAKLGIDVSREDMREASEQRRSAERAHAQQKALELQRLRHGVYRDPVKGADEVATDLARQIQIRETAFGARSVISALEAIEAVLTDEQKVRTATARATLREGVPVLCERAQLNHLHPITAEGLV